jgi:hypothetical protein
MERQPRAGAQRAAEKTRNGEKHSRPQEPRKRRDFRVGLPRPSAKAPAQSCLRKSRGSHLFRKPAQKIFAARDERKRLQYEKNQSLDDSEGRRTHGIETALGRESEAVCSSGFQELIADDDIDNGRHPRCRVRIGQRNPSRRCVSPGTSLLNRPHDARFLVTR